VEKLENLKIHKAKFNAIFIMYARRNTIFGHAHLKGAEKMPKKCKLSKIEHKGNL